MMTMKAAVGVKSRDVKCPECGARPGEPCRGSRIPSPATLGGGWGGPAARKRAHPERVEAARRRGTGVPE